jgi:two-component system phosphate regulon sensor histidine kinase PhoR
MSVIQTSEPILSLPLGTVVLVLLLFVGGVVLLVFGLMRRKHKAPSPAGVSDAPWLAALLDGLPQMALVVDLNGHPAAWNAAAARSLALTSRSGELPSPLSALVTRVLDTGVTETTGVVAADGSGCRLQATASSLKVGVPYGALILARDPAEATSSADSYRHLVGAMAHELRTPLTSILGHADILDGCTIEEDVLWRRSCAYIANEARRLTRLVEDLLTLSRLDLTPLQCRPVNLRAVVEEAISTLFQLAEEQGVRLSLQSPATLPRILGDRDRLQQVFLDLLDNAVKYSKGGEVVVCFSPEEGCVQVEVRDNGVGIAPEDLAHVFDPLYRGENVRDVPGTGLGLTIVRIILEQHSAPIDVQSALNQGTVFRFRLPLAQSSRMGLPGSS